jgi:hypothetical protein
MLMILSAYYSLANKEWAPLDQQIFISKFVLLTTRVTSDGDWGSLQIL